MINAAEFHERMKRIAEMDCALPGPMGLGNLVEPLSVMLAAAEEVMRQPEGVVIEQLEDMLRIRLTDHLSLVKNRDGIYLRVFFDGQFQLILMDGKLFERWAKSMFQFESGDSVVFRQPVQEDTINVVRHAVEQIKEGLKSPGDAVDAWLNEGMVELTMEQRAGRYSRILEKYRWLKGGYDNLNTHNACMQTALNEMRKEQQERVRLFKYDPGQHVIINTPTAQLNGVVREVRLGVGGKVVYVVNWWSSTDSTGQRFQAEFDENELRPSQDDTLQPPKSPMDDRDLPQIDFS